MFSREQSAKRRKRKSGDRYKQRPVNRLRYQSLEKRQLLATIVADGGLLGTQDWTATSTWIGGVLPGANDRAIIPQDLTVTLNAVDHTV
jgi:hypothetical protein